MGHQKLAENLQLLQNYWAPSFSAIGPLRYSTARKCNNGSKNKVHLATLNKKAKDAGNW
jgi:hypothetical protein